jgi:dihydropyrimidinase
MYDLVVKGGTVVGPETSYVADVAVTGERVAALGVGLAGQREIDAGGLYVLPGAIDGHVHLTDPNSVSPPTADSFASGSRAAAFGGVTTLVDFAESDPDASLADALERRREDADGHSCIDYGLHMIIRDENPARLEEIAALIALGVPSFKFFMAWEDYRLGDVALLRAMEAVAACDGLAIVHAEDEDVIQELRRRLVAAGRTGPRWHGATSPPVTESDAIHRALALAELAEVKALIYHISSADGIEELRRARARGQRTHGEVCVQYLVLSDELYAGEDLFAQSLMIRPPLRGRAHQEALWRGTEDGTVDIVSTDHCPRRPAADGVSHPSGTSGIEVRLALMHTFGVGSGRISRERWVELCCTQPAELFGLRSKGRLAPGYDADIVLFDPGKELVLGAGVLHSPIDYSTFQGINVTGFPVTTISRGCVMVADGDFVGPAAHGRFVERRYPSCYTRRQSTEAKETRC